MAEVVPSLPEIQIPGPDERTLELFWATKNWSLRSHLDREQFLILWNSAFDSYEIVEAHNFDHASASLWLANELADVYEAAGSLEGPVNRKILNAVSLLHDVGKQADFQKSSYETEEEFAAFVAGDILPTCGYEAWEIEQVQAGILSTAKDGVLDTSLKKIMGRVDLYNVGEPKVTFDKRTGEMEAEATHLQGKSFDRLKFMSNTILRLGLNLNKDLFLKGLDDGWVLRARANYQGMVEKFINENPESLSLALKSIGGAAIRGLISDRLLPKSDTVD